MPYVQFFFLRRCEKICLSTANCKIMPQEIRLWKVKDEVLVEVPNSKLSFEERLEEWLETGISIISNDLLVIDRQVKCALFNGEGILKRGGGAERTMHAYS